MLKNSLVQKFFAVFLVAVLFMVGSCNKAKESSALVVVNVLDKAYHDDSHIEGSVNIPFMDLEAYADKNWSKEKTHIVLYCGNYKCTASGMLAQILRTKGFEHVWAYEGGTAEWLRKGLPIVGASKEPYLQDYEASPELLKKMQEEGDLVINAEDLYKKMAEFK